MGIRVGFDEESVKRLDTAVDHHQDAATVYSAAAALIEELETARDTWQEVQQASKGLR